MSDSATGIAALFIAVSHVALFAVAWAWAARSRHLGFLALMVPAALAWVLAGYRLVTVLTYGTAPFAAPKTGLQTTGFIAVLLGFLGFFACAVGALITVVMQAPSGRRS
jgi:hypothetical protein